MGAAGDGFPLGPEMTIIQLPHPPAWQFTKATTMIRQTRVRYLSGAIFCLFADPSVEKL